MAESEEDTVDKLLNVVQGYKSDTQQGEGGGWVAAAVAALIALIAVAVFAWQQWQAGKERAKLLHEQAVRVEELHQADLDADIAISVDVRGAALRRSREALDEVYRLEAEAAELEAARLRARAAIDRISSWEDVDEIVD